MQCTYVTDVILRQHHIFDNFCLSYDTETCKEARKIIYSLYRYFCREQNAETYPTTNAIKTIAQALSITDYGCHKVDITFSVDAPIRDYPFVIYDGVCLNYGGQNGYKTHKAILENELQAEVLSTNVRELGTTNLKPKPIVFGNAIKEACFIEAYELCAFEEMRSQIHQLQFQHNFFFDFTHNEIYRI